MTDYGKPIGWWCSACRREVPERRRPTVTSDSCPAPIPMFERIPEGERPETDEPDDETVTMRWCPDGKHSCTEAAQGASMVDEAAVTGLTRFGIHADDRWSCCLYLRPPPARACTLADAVLWVAKGVLP